MTELKSVKLNDVTNLHFRRDIMAGVLFIISERVDGESITLNEKSAEILRDTLNDYFHQKMIDEIE